VVDDQSGKITLEQEQEQGLVSGFLASVGEQSSANTLRLIL
jgi:hypothetical protein